MSFSQEEIREFTIEAEELLDSCEKGLLALDQGADFKSHYDAIFRAFHSIKGAAGMMEMTALQGHMHQLENTLTEQKTEKVLGKNYIDLFLRGSDAARSLLNGKSINFNYDVSSVPQTVKPQSAPSTEAIEYRGRVLVLDDEPDLVELLCMILKGERYEVLGITDPTEAVERVKMFKPDALFTDVSMPKMTGIQVLAAMKASHPDVPVIFVSGHVNKDLLVEAIGLGVHGVIEKPFDISEVIQICNQAVKQHQSSKLLNGSMNLLMYQFSDLDLFLAEQGKEDIRKVIREGILRLLDQRRRLRAPA